MTPLARFNAMMTGEPADRRPNWELGAWPQARQRWLAEGLPPEQCHGDWFSGLPALGHDPKIFAGLTFGYRPAFDYEVLEETERYVVARNQKGIVTRALKEGTVGGGRMSMDQYLAHPVRNRADWEALKTRLDPTDPARYPADWDERVAAWRERDCPLVLGHNCSFGFYWQARELCGTEELSLLFHLDPNLLHDIFEYLADYVIELTARARRDIGFDYFVFNEDIAYKSAPLLSPATFATFIAPRLRRVIDEFKRHGVRSIAFDSDGNLNPLIPSLMDAGVDVIWPLEQAADGMHPVELRRRYGRDLRLWGGVDKRLVAAGGEALTQHLAELRPLVEEGGFVPHLDHTFPPDISRAAFETYCAAKRELLAL